MTKKRSDAKIIHGKLSDFGLFPFSFCPSCEGCGVLGLGQACGRLCSFVGVDSVDLRVASWPLFSTDDEESLLSLASLFFVVEVFFSAL